MKGNKYIEDGINDYYDEEYDEYEEENFSQKKPKNLKGKGNDSKTHEKPKIITPKGQQNVTQNLKTQDKTTPSEQAKKINSEKSSQNVVSTSSLGRNIHENTEDKIKLYNSIYKPVNYDISVSINEKSNINLVIIGHVDSGKSTIVGHLLYLLGHVDDRTMKKFEKESKIMKKNTFQFAWALDENDEERKRGVTMDIAFKSFETKTKKVTIIDAPGHKDFVPNMISGASFADCAILVIDSTKSGFDAGFFTGGQTKEHAILARSLGVGQIIIAINKLDMSEWSKERYEYVKAQVEVFLVSLDFKSTNMTFVPLSGLNGVNIIEKPKDLNNFKWYEGKTLIEAIDCFKDPVRNYEFPSRFMINDCGQSKIQSLQGFSVFGKVEGGFIIEGKEYLLMPHNIKVKARTLGDNKNDKVDYLKSGETGEIILNIEDTFINQVKSGNVLSSVDMPVPAVSAIKTQILTLDLKMPLTVGQEVVIHCQSQKSTAKIRKIDKLFNKSGDINKSNSKFVPKNFNAVITLDFDNYICLELYSSLKSLGRITLRDAGATVAAGIVLEILK